MQVSRCSLPRLQCYCGAETGKMLAGGSRKYEERAVIWCLGTCVLNGARDMGWLDRQNDSKKCMYRLCRNGK